MISDQARKGIDHIFIRAAKGRLALDPADCCEVVPLNGVKAGAMPEQNIVILTISSLLFRLLLVFHIDENRATRDYFVKDATDRTFADAFSEICNLCCGAVNRDLLPYFPDLGMSTPYTLSARCVSYLGDLNPGHVSRFAITINGTVGLHASVCLCAHAPIHFVVDTTSVAEETGELELF